MLSTRERNFFDSFPDFDVGNGGSATEEFHRLGRLRNWKVGGKIWRHHWRSCFGTQWHAQAAQQGSPTNSSSAFFNSFPGFEPDPTSGITQEFARLAAFMGWNSDSDEYHHHRRRAYQSELQQHWGSDADKLDNWQALCVEVGIIPAPGSITKCRKALKKIHVNLVDLIDSRRNGTQVRVFRSYEAFRRYTTATERIFPKRLAKDDGFIKALLRILDD